MSKYRVIVDRLKCISCAIAPTVCPDVFVLGEDNGKNRVVDKYSIEISDEKSIGIVPGKLYDCIKKLPNPVLYRQ